MARSLSIYSTNKISLSDYKIYLIGEIIYIYNIEKHYLFCHADILLISQDIFKSVLDISMEF